MDTGAVYGGELTALRWPERELVSVPAVAEHYEPVRPAVLATDTGDGPPGLSRLLDVGDVLGKHHVDTTLAGRVTIDAERSSAALEVMSRFAADPRWLVHLPPTMAPAAASGRDDCLEHPDEAFSYFAEPASTKWWSRRSTWARGRCSWWLAAPTQPRRASASPMPRPASSSPARAGPSSRRPALTGALLDRVRAAAAATGLWDRLDTDWLVLDAEVLPWSAKAGALIRRLYAATGAAGTTALGAASGLLADATERGLEVEAIAARTIARAGHVSAYVDAYRRYCWEVDGTDGIQIAPFQVLAAEGEVLARRPHRWHLEQIDALVDQAPETLRRTDRRFVDLSDDASIQQATHWWQSLTDGGGEGVVVKPAEPIVESGRGLVLPGVKCRGREYLRIIYGPEYLEPANLEKLRQRSVGRKSSLARREFALGIEALDRFVANEHLARVHQCVFGVLALESEPVDPRL